MVLSLVLFAPWLTTFTPLTNQKVHLPLFYPPKPHHTPNVSFYTLVYYIPGVYVHPISNSVKKTLTREKGRGLGRGRGRGRGGTCVRGRYEFESSQDLHFKKVEKEKQRCRSRESTHGRCMQVGKT